MNEIIDERNYDELGSAIALAKHTVYKNYRTELEQYPLIAPTPILLDEDAGRCLRFIRLEEFTKKKGEDMIQKLSTVYHASMSLECNLIVMVDVERIGAPAKIYIGVRNSGAQDQDRDNLRISYGTLKSGIKSNFPGTKFSDVSARTELPDLIKSIFHEEGAAKYISSVSCVAAARDKSKTENKNFVQGIERFIDAMCGHTYTAIFIAEPVSPQEQGLIREGYESLYSTLSSFNKSVWSYNENESTAVMESLCEGISDAVMDGTSQTKAHTKNIGAGIGINSGKSNSYSESNSSPTAVSRAGQAMTAVGEFLPLIGGVARFIPGVGSVVSSAIDVATRVMGGPSVANGAIKALGGAMTGGSHSVTSGVMKALGVNGSLNAGYAHTDSDTTSHANTRTTSTTTTRGNTKTRGSGRTLQIENVNKSVEEMLKQIDEQLNRMREGEDYGSYSCGAYFLSGRQESSVLAANTYRALMIGEDSSVESGAINTWGEPDKVSAMKEYLSRFVHPIFALSIAENPESMSDLLTYTAGTIVSGLELPLHLGLPTQSVYGLPVLEHAEFGRNVTHKEGFENWNKDDLGIGIGSIYHMGQKEKGTSVDLDVQTLASHTFITGSTGAGKSNTIYTLLQKLEKENIKFLVVEPAKGEYKTALGEREDVMVYGTNPKLADCELLQINPFSFPDSVHVLEHMDRLVEIFNVCWPMYAAMPAILKDAIERSYIAAGWDLIRSENKCDDGLFPTFKDVFNQIKKVLEESDYSADNKGDYTGALVTRIKSLTNGINGLIFTADDIPDSKLFDENVIVDLSRVGSSETKSLIMGLLVLKLQEHRMQSSEPNAKIHHITVLEEAHNLLKRTSTEQPTEGANLLGKSVEMLANAIAEMRTYGEGFVIADQSPGLLDMSVIRNTNTKIILRLPDFSDRELVGKAAGLNDDQIIELARLERGVAAVMQSDWLEPVLCKVDKYEGENETDNHRKKKKVNKKIDIEYTDVNQSLLECIMSKEIYRQGDRVDIRKLRRAVIRSNLDAVVKCDFIDYITAEADDVLKTLQKFLYDFFGMERAVNETKECTDIKEWSRRVIERMTPSVQEYGLRQTEILLQLILPELSRHDNSYDNLIRRFVESVR